MPRSQKSSLATPKPLSLFQAVALGLASMLGAGLFVLFREAFDLASTGLFIALGIAALIAALNAASVFSLASRVERAGGIYAYSRIYVGETTSFIAGSAFIIGKIGSIAAISLVFSEYLTQLLNQPSLKVLIAVISIALLAALNLLGIQRTAKVAVAIALIVVPFLVLLTTQFFGFASFSISTTNPSFAPATIQGILQAAALMFFAFAGYARVATLGPEVSKPNKNIPLAIVISLTIVTALYIALGAWQFTILGPELATAIAPVALSAQYSYPWMPSVVVTTIASIAALGSMLALLAGTSRTASTMAEDAELPKWLAKRNRLNSPARAEVVIAVLATALVLTVDVRQTIGISSFAVLLYYAIGHISVLRQFEFERSIPVLIPWLGLLGCVGLMAFVPQLSLIVAAAALVIALLWRAEDKVTVGAGLSIGIFQEIFQPSAKNAAIIREEQRESRKAIPSPGDKHKLD